MPQSLDDAINRVIALSNPRLRKRESEASGPIEPAE